MAYLLKVTVAWALFLLLFELLYKGNGKHTVNRTYLLLSMAIGLLLPLVQLPQKAPAIVAGTVQNIQYITQPPAQINPATGVMATPPVTTATAVATLNWQAILWLIYLAGVVTVFAKTAIDLYKIGMLVRCKHALLISGYKVIATNNVHAPYSFMGYIFITHTDSYTPQELDYILQHEAAHNKAKHWADLLLMQLACVALWFHPLVWRYRYLLRMQHEYEADAVAADTDPYTYGHFLLQQTLLNGVPSIAHSFHFSPIKNRINMLTKKHNKKMGGLKYLLLTPVLVACSLLMASNTNDLMPAANATIFRDNVVTWRESDTLLFDVAEKKAIMTDQYNKDKRRIVTGINGETVYENEHLKHPARYGNGTYNEGYFNYVRWAFHEAVKNTADSTTGLGLTHMVIGKDGSVVHYNVQYYKMIRHKRYWDPYFGIEPKLNSVVDKIITESPKWQPAIVDGKAVLTVVNTRMPGC